MARDPSSTSPFADGDILSPELLASLHRGLERLPDDVRRCFLLCHGRGFCESEIAVLMKLPIDLVRSHLWQARRKLELEGREVES